MRILKMVFLKNMTLTLELMQIVKVNQYAKGYCSSKVVNCTNTHTQPIALSGPLKVTNVVGNYKLNQSASYEGTKHYAISECVGWHS